MGNERATVQLVGVEGLDDVNPGLGQLGQDVRGDLTVALDNHLAGFLVHQVFGKRPAVDVIRRDFQLGDFGFFQLANMARGNTAALLHDDFLASLDIKGRHVTAQALGDQRHGVDALLVHAEGVDVVEHVEDFFRLVAQRAQQDRRRQLAATVDTHVHQVLRIELEVQP